MPQKGYKMPQKYKDRRSKALKGRMPKVVFQKGHKHSEETKKKISESERGKIVSQKSRKKISENTKIAMATPETREKISKTWFKNGNVPFNKGKTHLAKEKHPLWRGGISFEPYSIDWTETLRRSIRERDRYTCQMCGKEPSIVCHHIDYDKKNSNPDNLVTLCQSCHGRTHTNRQYWINYFKKLRCPLP